LLHVDPEYLGQMPKTYEVKFALENFEYLGFFKENPLYPQRSGYRPHHYWRCKLITEDGVCPVYETRPDVCRNYGVTYSPDRDCLLNPELRKRQDTVVEHLEKDHPGPPEDSQGASK
jgi:Fe-S-cluster containining protein